MFEVKYSWFFSKEGCIFAVYHQYENGLTKPMCSHKSR